MGYWIASPTGSPAGDGSIDSPWDLGTAVKDKVAVIQPGDTLLVRGGIHRTIGLQCKLLGEPGNPIIVRPFPGDRVVIDGNRTGQAIRNVNVLDFNAGGYVRWIGTRITNSATDDRVIAVEGSNPDERRGSGVNVVAPGVEFINNIVDNTGQGISPYSAATAHLCYGNIIIDNGWEAPDRWHGHGIYTQSSDEKHIRRNVVMRQFGLTLHAYGSGAAVIDHLRVHQNVFFGEWVSIGGGMTINDNQFTENLLIEAAGTFGGAGSNGLLVSGNYFTQATDFWANDAALQVLNNRFYRRAHFLEGRYTYNTIGTPAGVTIPDYSFAGNSYWLSETGDTRLVAHSGVLYYNAAEWVSACLQDADGTFYDRQPGAGDDTYVLWLNEFDRTLATLAVFNWSGADSVAVDLSQFAAAGERVRFRNCQDYFGDVFDVAYGGDPIAVDMRAASHSVSTPIGYSSPLSPTSFPTYGIFTLERVGATMLADDLALAAWTHTPRTLAAGVPSSPVTYSDHLAADVWAYVTRTVTETARRSGSKVIRVPSSGFGIGL